MSEDPLLQARADWTASRRRYGRWLAAVALLSLAVLILAVR